MKALVLGSGVSGLTCALSLREAGCEVVVRSPKRPQQTTSAVAAALWYPYAVLPIERAREWSLESYAVFRELAQDPQSGVQMRPGAEVFRERNNQPAWHDRVDGWEVLPQAELPLGYAYGYRFQAPVVEMSLYLNYLEARALACGVCFEFAEDLSSPDLTAPIELGAWDVLVHCTGLEAAELLDDREVYPARGQLLVVRAPKVQRFMLDEHDPRGATYVVPRSQDVVLGGTFEPNVWELRTEAERLDEIWLRCLALAPELEGAERLESRCGLRPCRSTVRLQADSSDADQSAPNSSARVIYNYGHGGAGVTLSWGCAREVVQLALASSSPVAAQSPSYSVSPVASNQGS